MSDAFQALMADLARGDPEAARVLFEQYGALLLRVIRRHLNVTLRNQVDSTDFIQETWLAFLKDLPKGRHFESPTHLAVFLAVVARNKVIDAVRRRLSQEQNVNLELSLQENSNLRERLRADESTPSQACVRREVEAGLLGGLRPAHVMIGLKILEGKDTDGVAAELKVSRRMVERVRERILERLEQP